MYRLTVSDARDNLASIISATEDGERFLLDRYGIEVAAIVSIEDLALLQAIDDRKDIKSAKKALRDIDINGTVSWDEIKEQLGL